MAAVELGVRHRDQPVAEHRGDGAGQPPSGAEVDVDVDGVWFDAAVLPGGLGQQGGLVADFGGLAPSQPAGRQGAAPPLGFPRLVGVHAIEHVAQYAVADRPLLESVDVDGHGVLDPVDLPRQRVVERAEEPLDRIPEECREVGERHVFGRGSGQRAGDERRPLGAVAFARAGRSQHRGVEREGLVGDQLPGDDVASVEGLQRMPDDDGVADLVRRRHVEGVEQLGQRHRGRSLLAGVFVGAGVGDHELLAGCADGVEQQLPVLGTNVALAGHRVAGEHVVAVDNAEPREHAVVQPDQADHPVRHRAHRHHRADRQRSGAEVGAGRASGQVAFQQCADVGQPHRRVRPWACAFQDVGEFALQLAGLPRVVIVDLGQQLDAVLERVEPVAQWSCAGE